jgi:Peptidase A4 family
MVGRSTMRAALLLTLGLLVAAAGASAAQGGVREISNVRHDAQISSNWAGYAVTGLDAGVVPVDPTTPPATPTTFSTVSARWVQPKAKCTKGRATFSAFWIGLGGYSDTSQALEQIGTEANCSAKGNATYGMWYELVPDASRPIKLKVFPGNVIAASVAVDGTQVTLQIRDVTRKTKATRVLQMSEPDVTSAEWIAEAPSACDSGGRCYQLPLANFGRVAFSRASVTAAAHTGVITDPAWAATSIQLVADNGSPFGLAGTSANGAVPSGVSSDGTSFTIAYQAQGS